MIEIRLAQSSDKESIISFCQNTFSWGDYLPDVWDDWMLQGDLLIATYNNIPVGVAHIDYLSDREAWFEGLRVHPDYRRIGVAQALSKAGFERAKQKGIEVGRALIAGENIASQTLSAANGFAKVADMHFWAGVFSSHSSDSELTARKATQKDLKKISEFLGQLTEPVYLWRNWRFVNNTPGNLERLIQECELYICAKDSTVLGVATVSVEDDCVKLYSVYAHNPEVIGLLVNSACPAGKKVEVCFSHKNFACYLESAGLIYQGDDGIWEKSLV